MDKPLVSILIPLYNAEKYIAETIESCLNQTYENIEIIILDDGSTDNSFAVAKSYADKHDCIHLYTHENSGAQVTRNKLFELSSGEYIQYLDADDLLHANKIKSQMDILINKPDTSIALCRLCTFTRTVEHATCKELSVYKDYKDSLQFLIDMWSNLEALNPIVWLIQRNLIENSGGWDTRLIKNQDGEFFARVVALSKEIFFVNSTQAYYRLDSANSVSKNFSYNAQKSVLLSIDSGAKVLMNHSNDKDKKYALARQYSALYFLTGVEHSDIKKSILMRIQDLGYKKPISIDDNLFAKLLFNFIGVDTYMFLRNKIKQYIKNKNNVC